MCRFDIQILVFFLQNLWTFLNNLIWNIIAVSATSAGANIIYEAYLLKISSFWNAYTNFPSIVHFFINFYLIFIFIIVRLNFLAFTFFAKIQVNIIFKIFDILYFFSIQKNWNSLRRASSKVIYSFLKQTINILINFFHSKFLQVRLKQYLCVIRGIRWIITDFWLAYYTHIVFKLLFVKLFVLHISAFNFELFWEDIGQLCPISVSSSCNFLDWVIIITWSQEVSKNQFWNINIFFLMHSYRNTFAVIPYFDSTFFLIDGNFYLRDTFYVSLNVVCRIYNNLVKYFEETRNKCYVFLNHFWRIWILIIYYPHLLSLRIYWANICIGTQKNVLKLSFFLVSLFNIFRHISFWNIWNWRFYKY